MIRRAALCLLLLMGAPTAAPALDDHLPRYGQSTRFELTPSDPSLDDEVFLDRLQVLDRRRKMLAAHQVLAWTAAFTSLASVTVGTINRVALASPEIGRTELAPSLGLHRVLVGTAYGTYWAAFSLAWGMPSPSGHLVDKGVSRSRTSRDIHIVLSIVHNVTMATAFVTGLLQANVDPTSDPLIAMHVASGVSSAALILTGAIVVARF